MSEEFKNLKMREIVVQWRGELTTHRYTIDADDACEWDDARVHEWLSSTFPGLILSWWMDC